MLSNLKPKEPAHTTGSHVLDLLHCISYSSCAIHDLANIGTTYHDMLIDRVTNADVKNKSAPPREHVGVGLSSSYCVVASTGNHNILSSFILHADIFGGALDSPSSSHITWIIT